jgi:hypothetical protein
MVTNSFARSNFPDHLKMKYAFHEIITSKNWLLLMHFSLHENEHGHRKSAFKMDQNNSPCLQ